MNTALATAIETAGQSIDELARIVGVDKTTIEQWLNGHDETPARDIRHRVAQALGVPSRKFWPEAASADAITSGTYETLWRTPTEAWRPIIEAADSAIDLLAGGYGWFAMNGRPDEDAPTSTGLFRQILDDKHDAGTKPLVRICMADPRSDEVRRAQKIEADAGTTIAGREAKHRLALVEGVALWAEAIEGLDNTELRLCPDGAYDLTWFSRFDNRLIWSPRSRGRRGHEASSISTTRDDVGGLFDQLTGHFEYIWSTATPFDGDLQALRP